MLSLFFLLKSNLKNKEDIKFFAELYRLYSSIMNKKAYNISQDYLIAEDMVQDSFEKLIDKVLILKSLEEGKPITYLVRTTRNITLNYLKRRSRGLNNTYIGVKDDGVDLITDNQTSIEDMYILKEDYEHLEEVISGLSKRDQQLLYDKYIFDLSDKEIAFILDIKEAHVRTYLSRARRRAMKLLLEKEAEDEKGRNCG